MSQLTTNNEFFYSIGISFFAKLPSNTDLLMYILDSAGKEDVLIDKDFIEKFNNYLNNNDKSTQSYISTRKNLKYLVDNDFLFKVSRAVYKVNGESIAKVPLSNVILIKDIPNKEQVVEYPKHVNTDSFGKIEEVKEQEVWEIKPNKFSNL